MELGDGLKILLLGMKKRNEIREMDGKGKEELTKGRGRLARRR